MEKFLTQKEVCAMLNISRPTLAAYIKEGKIKAVKYGRVVRIPASQFKESVENNERK